MGPCQNLPNRIQKTPGKSEGSLSIEKWYPVHRTPFFRGGAGSADLLDDRRKLLWYYQETTGRLPASLSIRVLDDVR